MRQVRNRQSMVRVVIVRETVSIPVWRVSCVFGVMTWPFWKQSKQNQIWNPQDIVCLRTKNPPSPLESYRGASIATRERDLLHARSGIPIYLITINIIYLIQPEASPIGKNRKSQVPIQTALVPPHLLLGWLWGTCYNEIDETFVVVMQASQLFFGMVVAILA